LLGWAGLVWAGWADWLGWAGWAGWAGLAGLAGLVLRIFQIHCKNHGLRVPCFKKHVFYNGLVTSKKHSFFIVIYSVFEK
jgi:hypothetical protein